MSAEIRCPRKSRSRKVVSPYRMNIGDSFYVALCMTVLLIGVVYWFWTQTQYLQRKMNLLETIVYELKGAATSRGPVAERREGPVASVAAADAKAYPPPPGSELGEDEDLLHEHLHAATDRHGAVSPGAKAQVDADVESIQEFSEELQSADDLQPGGVGSGLSPTLPGENLFSEQKPKGTVLDGMTLKELRRLAEQRNIGGASTMRKQAIIDALRSPDAKTPDVEGSPKEKHSSIVLSEETTLSLH